MRAIIVCTLCLLICSCSLGKYDQLNRSNIGFIGDYSKFKRINTNDDLKSFRYANEDMRAGRYSKVIIEKVDFYPEKITSSQINAEVLQQVQVYIDENFSAVIGEVFEIVDSPQEGAFIMTPRITTIQTTTGDIDAKEIIPIGTVIALSKAATGYRHQNIEVYLEVKLTDSVSGKFIGGSVKQGQGREISGANEEVTLDDIKPLLDIWVKDARDAFTKLQATLKQNP